MKGIYICVLYRVQYMTAPCPRNFSCLAYFVFRKNDSQLFFFISDPPGRPEIGGYMEGETIRLGQTVNLVCSSRGGNPLPDVVWYKDGVAAPVDSSYTTSGRESR